MEIKENVSLKSLTTFRIGGKARYFAEAENKAEILEAISFAKEKSAPLFVLGGGSNLLVSDAGFSGLILKVNNREVKEKGVIEAGAGVKLSDLVLFCKEKSLSGFEWASGIPRATVGGAIFMNAGAFLRNTADVVEEVEVFFVKENKLKVLNFNDCKFGYKDSIFKQDRDLIIFKGVFKLEKKEKAEVEKEIERALDYRKKHHPMSFPSAGSVFKNPFNISAREAIDKCGLKGKIIGDAQFSELHSNFIVNLGQASFKDVKALIDLAKREVKDKLNVSLEEEIQYL